MVELRTERLRLRPLRFGDLDAVVKLDADERVMATLGGSHTLESSVRWLDAQLRLWNQSGFGRFVVERDDVFVGLVGLAPTDFHTHFAPAIQIAWRLVFDHWGNGYATEAAAEVVRDGFDRLDLAEVIALTTPNNTRSRAVMERLGMVYAPGDTFEHPLIPAGDPLRTHVVYRLVRESFTVLARGDAALLRRRSRSSG